MKDDATIEDRLSLLEREVARLKERAEQGAPSRDWLGRIAGSMQTHPEFAKVLELGREMRRSERNEGDDA